MRFFFQVIGNLKNAPSDECCTVYTSCLKHVHTSDESIAERGLEPDMKKLIVSYVSQSIPPRGMLPLLRQEGFGAPAISKIYRILKSIKDDTVGAGSQIWSLQQLAEFAEKRSQIPDDEDQLFVPAWSTTPLPVSKFQIFMTTKRLIKLAKYVIQFF